MPDSVPLCSMKNCAIYAPFFLPTKKARLKLVLKTETFIVGLEVFGELKAR